MNTDSLNKTKLDRTKSIAVMSETLSNNDDVTSRLGLDFSIKRGPSIKLGKMNSVNTIEVPNKSLQKVSRRIDNQHINLIE
jgi:hypothetical protein